MRCRAYEKWISDDLDGALTPEKERRLRRHVQDCESCRTHAAHLETMRETAHALASEPVASSHLQHLREGLKPRLLEAAREMEGGGLPGKSGLRPLRWAPWAAVAVAAAALLLVLVVPRGDREGHAPVYALSFEETLRQLSGASGIDAMLEVSFDELWAGALQGASEAQGSGLLLSPFESPLLWESLTEEELRYIENELKKEMKS
jgi:predicted anti-sigma-YlaC factor YlaD